MIDVKFLGGSLLVLSLGENIDLQWTEIQYTQKFFIPTKNGDEYIMIGGLVLFGISHVQTQ